MKNFFVLIFSCLLSLMAHAESGSCLGKTESGKIVSIQYFTNGYSDNNIDYYAKMKIGNSEVATYALYASSSHLEGEVTRKSQQAGVDLGKAELTLSSDKKALSGSVGEESFRSIPCSYRE